MTYEIPDHAPRKKCQECGVPLAMVVGRSGKVVPVVVETGKSHFLDCPNPAKFSRKTPAPPAPPSVPAGEQGKLL